MSGRTLRRHTKGTVLTRAARKRAGLPPPTPIFKGVSKLKSETKDKKTTLQAKPDYLLTRHQRHRPSRQSSTCSVTMATAGIVDTDSDSSSSSSDDDEEGNPLWVQCDVVSCRKWRRLPLGVELNHSKQWFCKMHPDPAYQSCDTPEEKWKKPKKRAFTFNKLTPGQLVWAKMTQFSPWPAVVSPDPWSKNNHVSSEREGCIYHVEFLGKKRSHIWLPEERIEPYYSSTSCQLGKLPQTNSKKAFDQALTEAEDFMTLSNQERIKLCVYKEEFIQTASGSCQGTTSRGRGRSGRRVGQSSKRRATPSIKVKTEPNTRDGATLALQRITAKQYVSSKCESSNTLATTSRNASNQPSADTLQCTKKDMTVLSDTTAQARLFKSLGIDFSEANLMNTLTNSYVQRLQSQLATALLQNFTSQQNSSSQQAAVAATHKLQTPQQLSESVSVGTLQASDHTGELKELHKAQPKPTSSKPSHLHASSSQQSNKMAPNATACATSSTTVDGGSKRLTQSSLEVFSGACGSGIFTTASGHTSPSSLAPAGRVRRKKTDSSRVSSKRQRSPKCNDSGRKRRNRGNSKKNSSPLQMKSPTITDYFKSTENSPVTIETVVEASTEKLDTSFVSSYNKAGTHDVMVSSLLQDQCVPGGGLEWQIQNELQEIEDMLSVFETTQPIATSVCKQSPSNGKPLMQSDKSGMFLVPSGPSLSGNGHSLTSISGVLPQCGGVESSDTHTKGIEEDNLESVMTELHSIENLIQDLSNSQVVPY